jgi:hypothetical protein
MIIAILGAIVVVEVAGLAEEDGGCVDDVEAFSSFPFILLLSG